MGSALHGYFSYIGSSILLIAAFMVLYEAITPYKELKLIREGNVAASLTFGGAFLGFALTFMSSAVHSSSVWNYLMWAALGGAMQILAFGVACFVIRGVKAHIENNNVAVALGVFFTSVSIGILNAAALS